MHLQDFLAIFVAGLAGVYLLRRLFLSLSNKQGCHCAPKVTPGGSSVGQDMRLVRKPFVPVEQLTQGLVAKDTI